MRREIPENSGQDELLPLKNLLGIVRKRLWLILLTSMVFVGGAVGVSLLQTPQYEASVSLLVGQDRGFTDSPSEAAGLQQLTTTMATAADSRTVVEPVIEDLDLDVSVEEFFSRLNVQQVASTQFIEISYRDADPQTAQEVANALGEEFSAQIDQISTSANPITARVYEEASPPGEPVSPQPVRNGLLALGFGVVIGVGLAFLLDFFDDSWHSPEEAEEFSGVPTFGVIPAFAEAAKGSTSSRHSRKRREKSKGYYRPGSGQYSEELWNAGSAFWPVGMVSAGADGKLKKSNPTFREMLGYSEKEIAGADFTDFASHPDDVQKHRELHEELAGGKKEHYQLEKRLVKNDGQIIWARFTVSVAKGSAEGARPILSMVENITDRKQSEEALRLLEESQRLSGERLRAIVEHSPLVVHSFTPDGYPLTSDGSWDEFWRRGEDRVGEERSIFEDERVVDSGLARHIKQSVSDKEVVVTPELCYETSKNGYGPHWFGAVINPIRDEAGRVIEVMVVLEDVTDRRKAEEVRREVESRFRSLVEFVTETPPGERKES